MTLQQMRCLSEIVRQGLGVSVAARSLSISQPAVTKQLRQLENELGAPLFIRERNRIVELTPLGEQVIKLAEEICLDVDAIKRLGRESNQVNSGEIKIATTHAQAKFVLPDLMQQFSTRFKRVKFMLKQALPSQINSAVASGEVDFGVTPESDPGATDVTFLPHRSYARVVLFHKDHPLVSA